jgi:alkylhydroperoxidase family enzyme
VNRAQRRALFDAVLRDVCERPAHLSVDLRRAAAEGSALSGAVGRLVQHIREDANLVTDVDIDAARAEGLDDDQLYELTVATGLGESRRRLDAVARARASKGEKGED